MDEPTRLSFLSMLDSDLPEADNPRYELLKQQRNKSLVTVLPKLELVNCDSDP